MAVAGLEARPVHLRCEALQNPLGIDAPKPSLSWRSDNTQRNWRQSAYQILVATNPALLEHGKADVWDSGKQPSSASAAIAYAGPPLTSRRRYYWTVRVWDAKGHVEQSAQPAWWEMGLLEPAGWKAKWISWQNPEQGADESAIRWIWVAGEDAHRVKPGTEASFRLDFDLTEMPFRAALFLVAHGDWKVTVNGHDAGAKPHWNEFDRREIGSFLVPGRNSIDVTVKVPPAPVYGPGAAPPDTPQPAGLAALLKLKYADGRVERVPSGERWQARAQPNAPWGPAAAVADLHDTSLGEDPGHLPQPAALLRHEFALEKPVRSARLYATALGAYEMFLNGRRVGSDVLTPGFTQFEERVQYQTYDITALLQNGKNVVGAMLGAGWFASGISWTAQHFKIAPEPRFLAQIEVEYSDGSRALIATGDEWKAAESPILHAEIYSGEIYDARLEKHGWNTVDFNDRDWGSAALCDPYTGALSSQIDIPPRVVATIKPERVHALPNGVYVFDMGRNMVGWASLRVKGPTGTTVRLRFAEILNPDGSIYTTNLRNADATDMYTLRGGSEEQYTPRFTFHGFRYVEVTGYPGTPGIADISGQVVSSLDTEPTATITTSSELVNKMWTLGIWGQRGNFLSVPTDCPQRDERLGWMADAAVFWRTGTYNFDIAAFSHKWLRDVRDAQLPDGAFTNVSPNIGVGDIEGAPGWGDAGVIVPWTTWMQYGDPAVIERNWDAMVRWMNFIQQANPNFLRKQKVGPDFADWLAPDTTTPKDLVDTAYWALISDMMAQMARALHKPDEARTYSELYSNIRDAFQKAYVKPDGTVGSGSQTSYVVALHMKLLPPSLEKAAVDKLVANIASHDWHLTTGFLGTPYLLFALANHGRVDVAYRLLLNETYPSWGYMIRKGATTWWERWNGDTGDPAMNSYNHYAFGSVVAWVYQAVIGIDTTSAGPGFHEITIQPRPDTRLNTARGEYESVYGKISIEWHSGADGAFDLHVAIPANTSAKVVMPETARGRITQDGKAAQVENVGGQWMVRIGSGSYDFRVGSDVAR